jgi:hypothetical protein
MAKVTSYWAVRHVVGQYAVRIVLWILKYISSVQINEKRDVYRIRYNLFGLTVASGGWSTQLYRGGFRVHRQVVQIHNFTEEDSVSIVRWFKYTTLQRRTPCPSSGFWYKTMCSLLCLHARTRLGVYYEQFVKLRTADVHIILSALNLQCFSFGDHFCHLRCKAVLSGRQVS